MFLDKLHTSLNTNADLNAFCIDGSYYTYGEVTKIVASIQEKLLSAHEGEARRVGVVATGSIYDYASIIACWFTGCSYVPIAQDFPADRIANIIEQGDISTVCITDSSFDVNLLPDTVASIDVTNVVVGNSIKHKGVEQKTEAYVLFTSGSTGVPKGVVIDFSNIESFIDSYEQLGIHTKAGDGYLQMFELTFDVSVASFLIPLLSGGCIYTVPKKGVKYLGVISILKKYDEIKVATVVPSIIKYLEPYLSEISLPNIEHFVFTAEALSKDIAHKWSEKCLQKEASVYNLYGPTEATVWCTGYTIPKALDEIKSTNGVVAIGKPFKNVEVLIVDENNKLLPVGTKGEMLVESSQLSPGYLKDKEKTDLAFIELNGNRYYKTGDVCLIDEEGDIFYYGRKDDQIKVQGFRIELSEIDHLLRRNIDGIACVVLKYNDKKNIAQIGLVIEGEKAEYSGIDKTLKSFLPTYMLPSKTLFVKELPFTSSNKVDKVSLRKMIEND